MPRLLYFSRDLTTHDVRFTRALVNHGFQVRYVRLENDGAGYPAGNLPAGVEILPWEGGGPPLPAPDAVARLSDPVARLIERESPDIVHAGPVQTCGLMAVLAARAPTVVVSWGSDLLADTHRDEWHTRATMTALRGAAAFLCDSPAVLSAAQAVAGEALPPHLCIPWGLELDSYRSDPSARERARTELGWTHATIVVASRAWHPAYRVPELVDAFAAAARRAPQLRLLLLGSGADEPNVMEKIRRSGIGHLVRTPGFLEGASLHGALAAADVYASMVPSDGTSISLLEAMYFGLPPVVIRNSGNAWWVDHGRGGYLVDAGNVGGFADALIALTEPARARAMGTAARTVVQSRADWTQHAGALAAFYRATAGSGLPDRR